ncbi:MFS transporter [Bacillus gobiensis]|uniref:MFS transporter n=1 Tax=Bacillus gobiensis TaxID=1441095 RepID=UPI003D24018B
MESTYTETNSSNMKKSVIWIYYILFFAVLNESVFNVSTPDIAEQFDLSASGVSWVITVFIIIFGMGSVIFGKLSDLFSVKKLITIGIVLYGTGSILGFALQSWYPGIIISRAIQGAGASAIPALIMVIVAKYFSPAERGNMFGIITSTVSFAIGIGPVLGGYIAGSFHWSFLFLVPLPALIAIPFFQKLLPVEKPSAGKLDVLGAVLMGIAVSSLILFTVEASWFYLLIGVIALVLFIIRIRRADEPFVDPALFTNPLYRSGLIIGFLIFSTVMSMMFVIPLMLSNMYGLSTENIGLVMFPGAFSAVIFGRVAGKLTVNRGSHFVVYLGLILIALSLLLQSSSIGYWVWYIALSLIIMYIGFSFLQTALTESVTQILPPDRIGVGMGFYNMTSFISGAVGTAVVARVLEQAVLNFPLHPFVLNSKAYLYSNLILLLSLVVLASAILYYFTFGKKNPQTVKELRNES